MKKGISLIVLVITIIVIIILAGAVILSLANNNPIAQATDAVYKQDRVSVQSAINMFLANQMAINKANATVSAGTLGGSTGGVAIYPVTATYSCGPAVNQPFTFGTGAGNVGIALPTYTVPDYQWSITSDGAVTLTVAGVTK